MLKLIIAIKESLSKDHGISIMWEYITVHRYEEVN